jgi:hypothetical protein
VRNRSLANENLAKCSPRDFAGFYILLQKLGNYIEVLDDDIFKMFFADYTKGTIK